MSTRALVLLEAAGVGVLLTSASALAALALGWLPEAGVTPLEVVAVLTSYSCTYLCVVQSRMNYPVGVVTTALYCWLLWGAQLYASAAMSAILSVWLVYGWFRWGPDRETLPVTSVVSDLLGRDRPAGLLSVFLYTTVGALVLMGGLTLAWELGSPLPVQDSAVFALTAVAQLLLDNKRIETWAVWVMVNVVTIWLYLQSGLGLGAIQYVLFLANTLLGWWAWSRDARSLREMAS